MSLDISRQLEAVFHNPRQQPQKILASFALRLNENELSRVWKNNLNWNNGHDICQVKRRFHKQRTSVSSRLTNGASSKIATQTWRQCSRTKHHGDHCTEVETNNISKHVDFKWTPGSVWSPEINRCPSTRFSNLRGHACRFWITSTEFPRL